MKPEDTAERAAKLAATLKAHADGRAMELTRADGMPVDADAELRRDSFYDAVHDLAALMVEMAQTEHRQPAGR